MTEKLDLIQPTAIHAWYRGADHQLTKDELTFEGVDPFSYQHGHDDGLGFYITDDYRRAAMYGDVVTVFSFNNEVPNNKLAHQCRRIPLSFWVQAIYDLDLITNYGDPETTSKRKLMATIMDSLYHDQSDISVLNDLLNSGADTAKLMAYLGAHNYNYSISSVNPHDRIIYNLDVLSIVNVVENGHLLYA